MSDDRYRVNRDEVIDEVIDGEAVMIHLKTGSYYCTNASGALVWQALAATSRVTAAQLVDVVAAGFSTGEADVTGDVRAMLGRLRDEGLVVADDTEAALVPELTQGSDSYEAPLLETFTDLQDLLLLDPVHDVGAGGWPQADG